MVVVAVMVRRAGHCGGGVAEMGRGGKGADFQGQRLKAAIRKRPNLIQ